MNLNITPIQNADLPEARDVAGQDACPRLNGRLDEDGPIQAHCLRATRFARPRPVGSSDVKEKDSARHQRLIRPSEQIRQSGLTVRRVERIVDDLANRRDGHTRREVGRDKRADAELRTWHPLASQRDHRLRDVDAHDLISGLDENAREDAAAAAEIDHCAIRVPARGQLADEPLGRVAGHCSVALVVNVSKIFAICVHGEHRCLLVPSNARVSAAADQDRSSRRRLQADVRQQHRYTDDERETWRVEETRDRWPAQPKNTQDDPGTLSLTRRTAAGGIRDPT